MTVYMIPFQVRGSKELEVLLNYDCDNPAVSEAGDRMNLARLKLAIKYKQKRVNHFYNDLMLDIVTRIALGDDNDDDD